MKRSLGLLVALGASLLGLGCDGGDGDEAEKPCVFRATGAVTRSGSCEVPTLTHSFRHGDLSFSLLTPEGASDLLFLGVGMHGEPSVGSYTGRSEQVRCSGLVREGSKDWSPYDWDEVTGEVLEGSCTLTLTQVELVSETPYVKTYRFQGNVRAHLLPLESTGATGTVDLEADFVVE